MITVTLSKKELEYLINSLERSNNKELYNKLWRIKFIKSTEEKKNGFS
jgi:hypothetical protein